MAATIEAHGLRKRFGKTTALDGLDLVAASGQVVAVLGPNGAGKTTFVRALATLLRPDSGTLRVAGHDVRKSPRAVRRMIGLAGQFAAVEPAMTGRENLEMVARLCGQDRRTAKTSAAAVLGQLGLTEAGDRLVRTYSGGMRRRLDLGASLVGAPRLLLLDEPTTGARPAQPDRAVGRDPHARSGRYRRAADHPIPRRGRPSGKPDRDHRPRPCGRDRHADGAQAPRRRQRRRAARPQRAGPRERRRDARTPRSRRGADR